MRLRRTPIVLLVVLAMLAALPAASAAQRSRGSEADVSVSSVTATEITQVGSAVTIEAVIENPGRRAVPVDLELAVTPNGPTQSQSISVDGGSSQTASFTWTAETTGDYTSTVTATYANDPDPNNNSGSAMTTVAAAGEPQLVVASFKVSQVDDPSSIQLTAEVAVIKQSVGSRSRRTFPSPGTEVEITFTGPRGVETVGTGTTDTDGQVTFTTTIEDHPHGLAPWDYQAAVTDITSDSGAFVANEASSQDVLVRAKEQFVYATDEGIASGIYKLDLDGNVVASANTGTGYRNVATDLDGNIYAVNGADATVDVFDPDLNEIDSFPIVGGSSGLGGLTGVFGIALDREGNIYITDASLDRVLLFNPDGTPRDQQWSGGQLSGNPTGLTVDREGRIYVAEYFNNRVQVFDQSGNLLDTIGESVIVDGTLDVMFDGAGQIYVTDDIGEQVHVFTLDGTHQRSFGSGTLQIPLQNAIGAWDDTVYVADQSVDQLEIFDAAGAHQGQIDYANPSSNIGVTLGY